MIRISTRPFLLLSSKFALRNLTLTSLNNFITYKVNQNFNNNGLLFNNSFTFAELPKHKVLNMPALSPTMTQGKIVKWNVKEGDEVNQGDVICEVETDKATVGFESTEKGYIAKITSSDGMVTVGTPVAVLTKNKQNVSSFTSFSFSGSTSNQQTPSQPVQQAPKSEPKSISQPKPQSSVSANLPKHGMLKLPAVSPTMTEGKILAWKVKVGDRFDVGDALFSIETDKATVDYEATQKGFIAKIIGQQNVTMPVGQPVAVFAKKQEDVEKLKNFSLSNANVSQQSVPVETTKVNQEISQPTATQTTTSTSSSSNSRVFASPIAKRLAEEKGIPLSQISGSGPEGRVIKQDVQNYQPRIVEAAKVKTQPTTTATQQQQVKQQKPVTKKPKKVEILQNPYEQIALNSMRKTIANRLTESKTTIPHYYVQVAVEMGKVLELRQNLNKNEEGIKISVNDIIVKAVALALRDIPDVNSQWHGTTIRKFKHSDVSVAVATDGGLITPIVFRAETLGLLEIAKKTKDLAKRARQGKLDPSEFIGGTTTVSNLGMFGIDSVTSVINPPQSTILGVGRTQKKVVFNPQAADPKIPYKVVDSMELIVSADHRVVDGALASRWVTRIKKYLEDPVSMLL